MCLFEYILNFRVLLQGLWTELDEWIVWIFNEKLAKHGNAKHLKDKKGFWLDILCMMDALTLTKVNNRMKTNQGVSLIEFFMNLMDSVKFETI